MYGPEVLCNSFMQLYIVLSRHVDNKGTNPHFSRTIKFYPGRNKNDSDTHLFQKVRWSDDFSPFTTTLSSRKRAFCASWRRNHDFVEHQNQWVDHDGGTTLPISLGSGSGFKSCFFSSYLGSNLTTIFSLGLKPPPIVVFLYTTKKGENKMMGSPTCFCDV